MDNLDTVMLWSDACQLFNDEILPCVKEAYEQDGIVDRIARWEAWSNWTDSLCKDGAISNWQYNNWTHPNTCEG